MSTRTLTLAETQIPLREALSKAGNAYWSVMAKKANGDRYMSRYGVKIPALSESLPDFVEVDGDVVLLVPDVTQSGNPKVKGSESVQIDGRTYTVTIHVSDIGDDSDGNPRWNLIAKVIPAGGGGGGAVTDISDL